MNLDEHKIEELLKSISRTHVPEINFARARDQILRRIAAPQTQGWLGKLREYAPFAKIGAGVMASFLIVVSLTLGTAVAALESTPGSTIYPLKKIVENIQLKLAPADQKANLQIKFASNRAEELQDVLDKNQEGKLSDQEAEKIVAATVNDLQKSTTAAVKATGTNQSKTGLVNKLSDISNKLRAASIQSEGQVKIELEKALEANKITEEEAINNIERAGLKVENPPIIIEDETKASGKVTSLSEDSLSIGTAKFLITEDTKFVNIESSELKIGQVVDISGQIKDNKSYALTITLVTEIKTETPSTTPTESQ